MPKLKKLLNNYSREATQVVQRDPMTPTQGTAWWVYVPAWHHETPSVVTPPSPSCMSVEHHFRWSITRDYGIWGFLFSLCTPNLGRLCLQGPPLHVDKLCVWQRSPIPGCLGGPRFWAAPSQPRCASYALCLGCSPCSGGFGCAPLSGAGLQPGFILALPKTYGLFKEKLFILMKFNLYSSVQLSCVQLFTTPGTVARQAPLSMGFPR